MADRPPVISLHNLTFHFGEKVAVDNLELEVHAGEVFGFLGHNGAGKTTTVRLLNGILRPGSGQMQVLGLNPTTEGPLLRRRTGVLTETPAHEEQLTARDNLRIFASLYNVPRHKTAHKTQALLHIFDLAEHANEPVRGYSKGMKQRLALARALLHDPELLFLDEPTEGLDPVAARGVRELITKLSREEKRTVFLCTHNLAEAQHLCDRIAIIQHGRLLTCGTPQDLIHQLASYMPLRLDIEISPTDLPNALDTLQTVPGITVCQQGTNSVTTRGASHEMIPGLITMLVARDVRIYKVTPYEPSLEDVYFALHEQTREQ